MMRGTGKSYQKFSFQKSLPIGILSAALFVSLNAQAADAPKPEATITSQGASTTTFTTTKTVPAAPSSPAAGKPVSAANPAASTTPAAAKAVADDSSGTIAQVIWVKGTVKATQGAQPARVLARRSPIYQHDVLTTDDSGTGEVAFTDSSVLTLRESTELRVDEYEFKKAPSGTGGAGKEVMSLVKGGFRTITGSIPKANPDSYQVNTPVGTIGVRGTDYAAYYSKQEGLTAKIFEGRITVKNDQGLVELSKELSHLYALIKIGGAPVVLQKEPATFQSQPAPTPVTKGTINGIGTPGAGGGSKTVSSFCVGLLKDFTKSINDFFS